MYAYAADLDHPPDASASYCVDRLLPILRRERWALVLDGAEVAQHETGAWFGRFLHPELGRLLEELASEPLPGVVVLTTRFPLPTLERRRFIRQVGLTTLDPISTRGLLRSLGVHGTDAELDALAAAGGFHAKAVELLGTFLTRFHDGRTGVRRPTQLSTPYCPMCRTWKAPVTRNGTLPACWPLFNVRLSAAAQDVIALATAFRDPPTEDRMLAYLQGPTVNALLHQTWGRHYASFQPPDNRLPALLQELIDLRLLERVGQAGQPSPVIDAHPLVRRAFEHVLGSTGRRQGALARAGFLRGRPDRRRPETLEEAREEVEMFHAYCDAGLWEEADSAFVALDNPKHRFLAPALERDLLLRFFPAGNWRQPPLWIGFGRRRSLAICLELLGDFTNALDAYPPADAALRGDALIALGQLRPLLDQPRAEHPWQTLWQAYRSHALFLAGRTTEAVALARSLVPVDVYEWVHIFECLLRAGQMAAMDLASVLFRPPHQTEHRWADLARQRMKADYLRVTSAASIDLDGTYCSLIEAYDRGGLPYERTLTRLGYSRWLLARNEFAAASEASDMALTLARQYAMRIVEADAWALAAAIARRSSEDGRAEEAEKQEALMRQEAGYLGNGRP